MHSIRAGFIGLALLASAGCKAAEYRDASGIYVAVADRRVTLVQLVQLPAGKLTGRVQEASIAADGTIKEIAVNADGSISGHDLVLKPESIWYGGVQASGSISGDELTLEGTDFALTADRSSLPKYQDAVAHLRSVAVIERRQLAAVQAAQDLASRQAAIKNAANQLRSDAAKLNARIDHTPNFGEQAAANTARIARMLRVARMLSDVDRGQLFAAANQIEVGTNQIEVARSQYAAGLNQIIQDATPLVAGMQKACASSEAQFAAQCGEAKSAIADFQAAFQQGQEVFAPHKQQVQTELDRQNAMIQRIDG